MTEIVDAQEFTYARTALDLIRRRIRAQGKAESALFSELKTGFIRSIGIESTSLHSKITRRPSKSTELQYIPQRFWQSATLDDISSWRWGQGHFELAAPYAELSGSSSAWTDVRFETELLLDVGKRRSSRGRKRSGNWPDWIAAAVTLMFEGRIQSSMTESKLQAAVADKLTVWGSGDLADTTTIDAARAILNRLRSSDDEFPRIPVS